MLICSSDRRPLTQPGYRLCNASAGAGNLFVYDVNKQQDGVSRMAERSAIQRIKELDEERAKIFDQAKEKALQKATEAGYRGCS
jgi:hypothetical protein